MMLALLLLALAAPQDGVRGWRGDGSGVFPKATPPAEWSEKKNVKWHVTVGEGVSSPVVWENRVLVLAEPGTLVCLDRATGKIAWKEDLTADLPPEVKEKLRPPGTIPDRARATPVTDGKSIFVTLCSGLAASVSIDGKRRWVRAIEPAKLQYGPSASPVLVGTTLLVDSTCLTALDAETGAPRWTAPEAETHYGTPAILTLGGKAFAVTPKGAVVRISDGAVVAKEIASGLGGDQAPTPVLRDGIAYFAYRHSTAVRLSLEGEKLRHEKVWEQDLPAEVTASPVLHDGMLFVMASGQPEYCVLSEKTGEILLRKTLPLSPNHYPSLALAGGHLFVGNDRGEMFVLQAGREYKEVRRNELPDGSSATPAFDGSHVFLRSGDVLYCVGP